MALLSCEFFWYKSLDASKLPPPYDENEEGYVGLLSVYDDQNQCQFYDDLFLQNNDFNNMFLGAQFAALIGPSAGFLAFLINLLEWVFCIGTFSYFLTFAMLFIAFVAQGLTFLVYGENNFWCVWNNASNAQKDDASSRRNLTFSKHPSLFSPCLLYIYYPQYDSFDDLTSADCQLKIGAILSIAASGAFYLASVIWCCMPRPDPACSKKATATKNLDLEDNKDSEEKKEEVEEENFDEPVSSPQQDQAAWVNTSQPPMEPQHTNNYQEAPPEMQQPPDEPQPPVQESDFENPFEDGANVQNYERPTY